MKLLYTALGLVAALPSVQAVLKTPVEAACETAYAFDGGMGGLNSQCFSDPGWGSDATPRWGWVLNNIDRFSPQTFEVWAGAGGCDISKGVNVGSVTVSYDNGVCTATWNGDGTSYIEEMHFYCSNDPVPPKGFKANGKFPAKAEDLTATTHTLTVDANGDGSPILPYDGQGTQVWAIVHLVACGGGIIGDGDPHFKTWNGKWFDYMGECDLKMVEAAKFDGKQDLTVNVRTTIHNDYSYIESAAIQIGDDVLEVGSFGDYAVNGVDTPSLQRYWTASYIGGYELFHTEVSKKKHVYDIVISPTHNITLASYKQLVSVNIGTGAESEKFFGNSRGIAGSYSGDLLARDGRTIMEAGDAFGQEWQVRDDEPQLFRTNREPQFPVKCTMPPPPSATQRRLGESIAQEAAEKACAHRSGVSFTNCVYDVMAIGDLELADAGSA